MELNPLQTRVAQLYQEGLYAGIGTWEDARLTHDALFLFLLQEAEGCLDLDILESHVAVVSEHLQVFLDDLATTIADAAEDSL
ncbi:hypothetical protein HF289_03165 [Acidithiobacillus ferrooxidans]|jgi:hypothetical protein|uniref:hypothetical protein n=1 Tax=Acidithiobacillus ferrooxidans TaxID=920 RepID=UPI001C07EC93|nr:hypothetical protein [Acidithiobacillus ferrooxidans]MBU2855912.1 hypothetical protein [Acidithiobacillus ferrooxidans]MBU2859767.1 hypothetical protein [Acidithiobacillus ferrooxidans]MBU2861217.1 hypothetical protein [Acidithiobacillus ferrooxidans]